MKNLMIAIGLTVLTLGGFHALAQEQKDSSATLLGQYRLVAGERNGQAISKERLKEITVGIAAKTITTFDRNSKEVYAATYTLDTSKTPWHIKMTATLSPDGSKGTVAHGLIQAKDGDVRLIYALPGGKSPTDFNAGEMQQMFVLKRTVQQ